MLFKSTSVFTILILICSSIIVSSCDGTGTSTPKAPISSIPGSPEKIVATYTDNQAKITWETPVSTNSTGAVMYYQVERSILNTDNFIKIGTQLPSTQLKYNDLLTSRKFGDSFEYRITAGNSNGEKASALSLPITPGDSLNISHVAPNYLTSSYAKNKARFGFKIAFSADGIIAAVGTERQSYINGQKGSASVEIFKRNVENDWNAFSVAVIPKASLSTFALSPDGKTLALSDLAPNSGENIGAGSVEIFSEDSNGQWNLVQSTTLVSPTPGKLNRFGSALVFSPDSKILAIAETGTGIVRMYTRVNEIWAIQASNELNITAITERNMSLSLAFSPDGKTLAVGDQAFKVNNMVSAGRVQLFERKIDNSWDTVATTRLTSSPVGSFFYFGETVAFSADGQSLAVGSFKGEVLLDNTETYRGGNVQMFTKDKNDNWNMAPDATFVSSVSLRTRFGQDFSFNRSGDLLAVSEGSSLIFVNGALSETAGAVMVYKKDSSGAWDERPVAVLGSLSPVSDGEFGWSVVFNPSDDTLFVGEPTGLTQSGLFPLDTGYINIYDSRLF